MEKFTLYRHKHNTDVALMPTYVVPTKDYLVLKIQWFNVAGDTPFFMGLKETIRIKNEDIKNWLPYKTPLTSQSSSAILDK